MDWKKLIGHKIFVSLKSGAIYNGIVEEVELYSAELSFITITDIKNKSVTFPISEIIKLVVEDGK